MSSALRLALALTTALTLGACSTVNDFLTGDKIDYKSQSTKTVRLEVPPDLTQLQRDSRYQPQSGVISRQICVKSHYRHSWVCSLNGLSNQLGI